MDPDAAFHEAMTQSLEQFVADLAPAPPVAPSQDPSATLLAAAATAVDVSTQLVEGEEILTVMPAIDFEPPAQPLVAEFQSCDAFAAGQLAMDAPESLVVPERVEAASTGTSETSFAADTSETSFAATEDEADDDRSARLTSAVRLTGEAVRAWASLLRAPHVAYHDRAGVLSR
jgi:hypothetical protein